MQKANLIQQPKFHIIIKNILIRIALLSYFHCDKKLDININSSVEKSSDIITEFSDI